MNKKVFALVVVLLALSMLTTLVQAKPYTERNNEKFERFAVSGLPAYEPWTWDFRYIPSEDNPNVIVASWDEVMTDYVITVGANTYHLDTDFTYTGHAVMTIYDPDPWPPVIPIPYAWSEKWHLRVDYMYDFSAGSSGIEGTIEMLAIFNEGGVSINSLRGTGDLKNVQIKATTVTAVPPNIAHEGIVSGWPD